jgi:hypothetical protein
LIHSTLISRKIALSEQNSPSSASRSAWWPSRVFSPSPRSPPSSGQTVTKASKKKDKKDSVPRYRKLFKAADLRASFSATMPTIVTHPRSQQTKRISIRPLQIENESSEPSPSAVAVTSPTPSQSSFISQVGRWLTTTFSPVQSMNLSERTNFIASSHSMNGVMGSSSEHSMIPISQGLDTDQIIEASIIQSIIHEIVRRISDVSSSASFSESMIEEQVFLFDDMMIILREFWEYYESFGESGDELLDIHHRCEGERQLEHWIENESPDFLFRGTPLRYFIKWLEEFAARILTEQQYARMNRLMTIQAVEMNTNDDFFQIQFDYDDQRNVVAGDDTNDWYNDDFEQTPRGFQDHIGDQQHPHELAVTIEEADLDYHDIFQGNNYWQD